MSENKNSNANVSNLLATANWFSELSRNASQVARAYRAADRKAKAAEKAVRKAVEASRKANLLGNGILGGNVTANGSNVPAEVPLIVTDPVAHKEMWARWFSSQQAELDAEAAKAAADAAAAERQSKVFDYEKVK